MLPALALAFAALQVWPLDPLQAVFADTPRGQETIEPYDAARGEVAEWQIALRGDQPVTDLKISASALKMDGASIGTPRCRYIGYVKVMRPPTWPSSTQLRKPPADFPDPLMDEPPAKIEAGQTEAFWVDLDIPKSAKPGLYTGQVSISADGVSGQTIPIQARVYGVTCGRNRFKSTNWYFPWPQFWHVPTRHGETEEDAQVRVIAKSLAAHRQNVAMASALDLAKFGIDAKGNMTVDFAPWDRRVELLMREGVIGTIEGGGMGTRTAWAQPNLGLIRAIEDGKIVAKALPAADPQVDKFYSFFFPALLKHLKEKRWDKIYLQHVVDEPCDDNVDTYRRLVEIARKYLPGIRLLDTCCGVKFAGLMDVYSPELDFLNENYDLFKGFQKSGKELWFYTCWKPQGEYANRLIEEPLIKTRLLPWISFKYGITGYLHWGYDYWAYNPSDATKSNLFVHDYSPGGDAWITYPGKNGDLLDSRRNESMRDGIADNELLCMLEDRDPAAARKIVGEIVEAMDRYDLDVAAFRAARRELLSDLAR